MNLRAFQEASNTKNKAETATKIGFDLKIAANDGNLNIRWRCPVDTLGKLRFKHGNREHVAFP